MQAIIIPPHQPGPIEHIYMYGHALGTAKRLVGQHIVKDNNNNPNQVMYSVARTQLYLVALKKL